MAHFAKVLKGKVIEVIVAEIDFFDTYVDNTPGRWIQTSYNTRGGVHTLGGTPLRKNYAGVGYTYNEAKDAFIEPQPFPSWILDEETCLWNAPTEMPTEGDPYIWDEESKTWKVLTEED